MQIDRYIALAKAELTKRGYREVTDYRLAKELGVAQGNVGKWREGRASPSPYACLRLSELTGEPLGDIVAAAEFDKEADDHRKLHWATYLGKLGGLCMWATLLCVGAGSSRPAVAASSAGETEMICIMSTRRRTHIACLLGCFRKLVNWRGFALAPYGRG